MENNIFIKKESGDNKSSIRESSYSRNTRQSYIDSLNTSERGRDELLKRGQLLFPSERLGVDVLLKNDFKLKEAISNPSKYLENRTKYLLQIKDKVNKVFAQTFDSLSNPQDGSDPLPTTEATRLALESSKQEHNIEMAKFESQFPSFISHKAYEKGLADIQASRVLQLNE